jgi:purine-binding chemotaxis protein CheW
LETEELPPESRQETLQFCLFERGAQVFAIGTALVQEAVVVNTIVPVPRAPETLVGIANLRGDILPILNLDRSMGVRSEVANDRSMILIIRDESDNTFYGVLTDRVFGVRTLDASKAATTSDPSSIIGSVWPDFEGRVVHQISREKLAQLLRDISAKVLASTS